VLTQAIDFREECNSLYELLEDIDDADWNRPTQFKRWTANDILGHLHLFDGAAAATLQGPEAFSAFTAGILEAHKQGVSGVDYTRQWLRGDQGRGLLQRWRAGYQQLADEYQNVDPSQRVKWAGPDMSVRSCISARQMEAWSHGQAIFDLFGRERVEHDRLRNIAIMAINTFGWTFANRKLPAPQSKPHVRLISPSGALWEWNDPGEANRIEGSAVEFCRVATQTRNILDTQLHVVGDVAQRWMSMAQCFAGPPHPPPEPGTRFVQR
jgi:uncharacterized protein (TIGR03084 family)